MDYIRITRVGEVEEEHCFNDITIEEWLVINKALEGGEEDSGAGSRMPEFNIPAALRAAQSKTNTIYGGLKE